MRNPGDYALFAWQTAMVFSLRSAQLWAAPATAASELSRMALEKQTAFAKGAIEAGAAALRGADPAAVAAAALRPARRRVSANARALVRPPKRSR